MKKRGDPNNSSMSDDQENIDWLTPNMKLLM